MSILHSILNYIKNIKNITILVYNVKITFYLIVITNVKNVTKVIP